MENAMGNNIDVSQLLSEIQYFHGTGNLAHDVWEHKYASTKQISGQVKQVLSTIFEEGLRPFFDPLNIDWGATVSITKDPMYAILYSLCYAEKWTSKTMISNRGKEWWKILWKIWKEAKPYIPKQQDAWRPSIRSPHSSGIQAHDWTRTFNDTDYHGITGTFKGMIWGESNISGNFPVVLWIKSTTDAVECPGWNEIRVRGGIWAEDIGAIFVPEKYMWEVPVSSIPVLPLENLIQIARDI